ncbi:ABC-type transport system involved in multi-copper enzyme maturation permease subunit [Metabacillus crassostreae]|uniref:ABC transporter permease n=1 Tax=Metabacillus crassostreae TaxID=929098 RepID=UPI001957BBBE|nr:ABC-type transport system involved in multi-copper enzyme maturation permease subunit [Metabacillus crassostreae]
MLKLITLEIKKFKLGGYVKAAFIANVILLTFLFFAYFVDKSEGLQAFKDYNELIIMSGTFIRLIFIIFSAVILSRLIIEEYKSNTISLLFTYPISRKKIILSKLIIVFSFTFISIVLSNIFIVGIIYFVGLFMDIVLEEFSLAIITSNLIPLFLSAISSAGLGLLPLYFGMKKKSIPATIISAIIITSLVNSTITDGFSLYNYIVIPLALGGLGILMAYLSIRNIDTVDV